ncbi:preprotein translocase subunit SecE [Christensenellaceae bacterium NSJ-44]|jgi:preprotein translocase subunit SecE|uniref:Protein translocase subunit SecE n=1 Tax=Luoshenia tenuis TaxID=2763654 RepID=A0A926D1I4_9FIRM|nr:MULTISPECIES: preprotein translocase subunit SecE [Clostridia]MBC8530033.1 preprotein translocase subunit SecE [Luoshenia tenuis]SCJ71860.1 Preprotein translocase subunit secE [uncultured Clostridium sp.]
MAGISLKKDPAGSSAPEKGRKGGVKAQNNKKQKRKPFRFVRESLVELKKVNWPSRKELISYTVAVVVFVILFMIVIGAVDLGLSQLYKLVIN